MRAFIAVEVESEKLRALQKQFEITGVKLTDHFHITLKFFREISEKQAEEIKNRLNEIKFDQFELEIDGLGTYPSGDYVRVIWVGVKSDKIYDLQKEIDDKLADMFPKDTRFSSHITLGRVKFVTDKTLLLDRIKNAKVEPEKLTIKEFRFIRSTLEKEGPVYEDLAVFKLG